MKAIIFCLAVFFSTALFAQECEIYYSFDSHPNGWKVLGQALVQSKSKVKLNDWRPFMTKEDARLDDVLNKISELNAHFEISKGNIIQGGYKGKTQLSLRRTINTKKSTTENNVLALASIIGYIYVQDSVLLICEQDKGNVSALAAAKYELIDTGKHRYLDAETASMLYGMVIGRLNNFDSMGYSFDLKTKTYMVLEFGNDDAIKNTLQDISADLEKLSRKDVKLKMTTTAVSVYFPANDWSENETGQKYLTHTEKFIPATQLKQEQLRFIKNLSVFLTDKVK